MITDRDDDRHEPHASSPTDHILQELQLYGYRPFQDEPDPRPLPEGRVVSGAVADIFDALIAALQDTRLEPDLGDLLWSTVNLFHRAVERIERELDDNEQAQRRSQREQDGGEVKSVELERLTAEGQTLLERRDAFELMRDQAAEHYERHTGSSWRPRGGSMVNHRNLTSAMIDSRDFLAAKKRSENEVLLPTGPKIVVTGGLDFNDHRLIWAKLDQVHAKHPDMVLLHGGSPKGAERIAARWADHRKVPQIAFKPDWAKHAKAAPFKRNDAMLEILPIGVIVFPGTGIQENLADKARKLGIPVWRDLGMRGDIIKTMHRAFAERGQDRGVGDYALDAAPSESPIVGRLVDKGLHDELSGEAYAVIDGTDGRAHHVRFRGVEAFEHAPPIGGVVEVRRFGGADDPQPTLILATRSDFDLDRQIGASGATWLDHRLVERSPTPLAMGGFGGEVREAMRARAEHLIAEGLAQRRGGQVIFQRDLLATLRGRELNDAAAKLSAETGLPRTQAAAGNQISGVYRQRLTLASGRFAMIDDGLGFQLVPWSPTLEKKLGQHVSGIARDDGGIEWSIGRKRGLGL